MVFLTKPYGQCDKTSAWLKTPLCTHTCNVKRNIYIVYYKANKPANAQYSLTVSASFCRSSSVVVSTPVCIAGRGGFDSPLVEVKRRPTPDCTVLRFGRFSDSRCVIARQSRCVTGPLLVSLALWAT